MGRQVMNRVLTPQEAADFLQVGYRKVLDMISLGELTAFRVGRLFRIPEREIYRYLDRVKVRLPGKSDEIIW